MKNTFGNSLHLTVFGESHGPAVGAVIDGLAPGIKADEEKIAFALYKRRPFSDISTPRREKDEFSILSGVYNGYTSGSPLCIVIPNRDVRSEDYGEGFASVRPGHADYTAFRKYNGFSDPRGGGHFSGRITAAVCAAGSIITEALAEKGIKIGTHIKKLAGVNDREFGDLDEDIEILGGKRFAVLDDAGSEEMTALIRNAAENGKSVGGVLETAVTGLDAGTGEPFFDSVESVISHAMFSIGGVKGVEFGAGFGFADMTAPDSNDAFRCENGKIYTLTNNNGGVNGGITNGMPLIFRCAVKPTPSVSSPQQTVDVRNGGNIELNVRGRHDPCIVHRVRAVVDALTAFCVADLLCARYGTEYLAGKRK